MPEKSMPPTQTSATSKSTWLTSNLKSRVMSGVIMATVTLGSLWVGVYPFAVLIAALSIVMAWEWSRLVRGVDHDVAFIVHAAAVAFAALASASGMPAIGVIALIIAAVLVVLLTMPVQPLLSGFGVFYCGLPAIALVWLRGDEPLGFLAVLFVFIIVWLSDTAAYISGNALGGPKLWPDVSPNKTWAGLLGALVASAISGAIFAMFLTGGPVLAMMVTGVVLGAVAQAGDLFESALKRHFDVKDVSGLIPGHGGVMDRLDSVVAVAAAAGILALLTDPTAPARALFFGG